MFSIDGKHVLSRNFIGQNMFQNYTTSVQQSVVDEMGDRFGGLAQ